jgi:ATP-dependent RNA helicase HelY
MRRWASGGSLADALAETAHRGRTLPPGDFVRWCRQCVDLLEQLRGADPTVAEPARAAVAAIRRGVVAPDG